MNVQEMFAYVKGTSPEIDSLIAEYYDKRAMHYVFLHKKRKHIIKVIIIKYNDTKGYSFDKH